MSKKNRSSLSSPLKLNSSNPEELAASGYGPWIRRNVWPVVGISTFLVISVFGASWKYLDEDAQRQKSVNGANKQNQSLVSRFNPLAPPPTVTPTPQLSKEYIYAGGKMVSSIDAGAQEVPPGDIAVFRPSSGVWYILGGPNSAQTSQTWGTSGDMVEQGDYDGDGKTDFAVFRPSTNTWWILRSSDTSYYSVSLGSTNDIPAPADYDGDGKTDTAVFRPSTGYWYIIPSSTSTTVSTYYGTSGDTPTPKDFDGDGKADIAVWRSSGTPTFYILRSSDGANASIALGSSGDTPVPADYDGDGKADGAVWRPSNRTWYYKKSSDGVTTVSYQFGVSTDIPVQNDYDGDGKVDMALWRPTESARNAGDVGKWYIYQSSNSTTRVETWGQAGDTPVPAYYRR
jgi:FG-GAP-like repeat